MQKPLAVAMVLVGFSIVLGASGAASQAAPPLGQDNPAARNQPAADRDKIARLIGQLGSESYKDSLARGIGEAGV